MRIIIEPHESKVAYGIFEKKVNEEFPDLFDSPHDIWKHIENGQGTHHYFTLQALESNKDNFKNYVESVSDHVRYEHDDSVTKDESHNRLQEDVLIYITDLLADIAIDALEEVIDVSRSAIEIHGLSMIISEHAYRVEVEEEIPWEVYSG